MNETEARIFMNDVLLGCITLRLNGYNDFTDVDRYNELIKVKEEIRRTGNDG